MLQQIKHIFMWLLLWENFFRIHKWIFFRIMERRARDRRGEKSCLHINGNEIFPLYQSILVFLILGRKWSKISNIKCQNKASQHICVWASREQTFFHNENVCVWQSQRKNQKIFGWTNSKQRIKNDVSEIQYLVVILIILSLTQCVSSWSQGRSTAINLYMYVLTKFQSDRKFVNILAEYCTITNNNRDEMKLLQGGMFVIFAIVSGERNKIYASRHMLDGCWLVNKSICETLNELPWAFVFKFAQ